MERNSIVRNFEGKTIFVTGSTGFLAKVFVEKILRIQPNVKRLFLLIRGPNVRSVEQRLHQEIFDIELFRVLRERWGENFSPLLSTKVMAVCGDISHENLGIADENLRREMCREIDYIVNSAATTSFVERFLKLGFLIEGDSFQFLISVKCRKLLRYDVSLDINTFGAVNVLNFAEKCSNLKLLLHVSTAYVCGTRSGLILEKPLRFGETLEGANKATNLDIEEEKKLVQETKTTLQSREITDKELTIALKDLGVERANLHGWPNTYSFTKAMGEMLLGSCKKNVNVVILRPTIITSTWREPFPGWMEGIRTIDSIFVGLGKQKIKVFLGDPDSTVDMIPGDMVVNSMLVAMAIHSDHQPSRDIIIYNIGSSVKNPFKIKDLKWVMYHYLKAHPLKDDKGRPLKVGKPSTLSSMTSYSRYIRFRYLPLLKMLKLLNVTLCYRYESSYVSAKRKLKYAMRLAEIYSPYLFFHGIFDDTNTENLRMVVRPEDRAMFDFDPKSIQWEEYFSNIHFPGIVNYVLKQT